MMNQLYGFYECPLEIRRSALVNKAHHKTICYCVPSKYLPKVNIRNARKRCKICSKLAIETTERRQ